MTFPASLDDDKYNCCCGCHVLQGSKIIAIISAISCCLEVLGLMFRVASGTISYDMLSTVIGVIVTSCLCYGLFNERQGFIIPYLVVLAASIVGIFLAMIVGVFYFGILIFSQPWNNTASTVAIMILFLAVIAAGQAFNMWIFKIVKNAYCYIEHKRYIQNDANQVRQIEQNVAKENLLPPNYEDSLRVEIGNA